MIYSDFVAECKKTIRPECTNFQYLYSGLKSEIGEVFGKLKKFDRGDFGIEELREGVRFEIGDVLWYIAMIGEYVVDGDRGAFLGKSINLMSFCMGVDFPFKEICLLDEYVSHTKKTVGRWREQDEENLIMCCSDVAESFNLTLEECAVAVIEKLKKRKEENKICGDGDYR